MDNRTLTPTTPVAVDLPREPAATTAPPDSFDTTRDALSRAVDHLLSLQHEDGHWCAELEGDSILQSEYLLMKWMLGHERDDPRLPRIADYLRDQQWPDGSWRQYPGAKSVDLSATVKGYLCLKLMGDDTEASHMQRAREIILDHGGLERCNSFTKFYLAGLGVIDYRALPSIPPEIVYLPKWFYFHLDKLSSWTRTMIQPLSIVVAHRFKRELPARLRVDELYDDPGNKRRLIPATDRPHPFWCPLFKTVDRFVLKPIDALGLTPWRKAAIGRMERWIVDHHDRSDGMGAIFPPMVYTQVALRCLAYADDHPLLTQLRKDLDDFMVYDDGGWQLRDEDPGSGGIHLQPCFSPVWDTGIAAYALTDSGLDRAHGAMRRCADWLVRKECRFAGDWRNNLKEDVAPSGWFFEYENQYYPDNDDTVMVAMALKRIGEQAGVEAAQRGIDWVLAMQNDDGGWAAFDRDAADRPVLDQVPFADHNAMQDPSCPDITGRTLESLGHFGYDRDHPAVARAIAFMHSKQEDDGCWFGRWGVNYIYGTWQVVGGLQSVGYSMDVDWVQRAGQWLKDHQQPDGAFGESADSYEDPMLRGTGPATASQTAWGAMALMAICGHDDPDAARAIRWLCDTQLDSGTWDEPYFTGTGFPRVFYLRYHLYRLYFPVMAIGRHLRLHGELPEIASN